MSEMWDGGGRLVPARSWSAPLRSIHVNSVVVGTYVGYDYAIPVIGVREILDKPETGIHVYGSAMWGLLKAWIAMLHKSWLGEYEGIVGD